MHGADVRADTAVSRQRGLLAGTLAAVLALQAGPAVPDAAARSRAIATASRPPASRVIDRGPAFLGYRALVIRPDDTSLDASRGYDLLAQAELQRRGMEVVCSTRQGLDSSEGLTEFDLIVTNVQRQFTAPQRLALAEYVAQGGALYGSWGGPLESPELLAVCGIRNGRLQYGMTAMAVTPPLATGLETCRLPLPVWVGDARWARRFGVFEPAGGTCVAQDNAGNCTGVLGEFGRGRTAVLGFGPENPLWITQDLQLAARLFTNLLNWLMPQGPRPHPWANEIRVSLPRRAQIVSVSVGGRPVATPEPGISGSLTTLSLSVAQIGAGETTSVQVSYEPLGRQRSVETWIHLPGARYLYPFGAPTRAADFLAQLGATTVNPMVRWCGGADFFRPPLPLAGEEVEEHGYDGDYLADFVDACHQRGIRVIANLYLDWERVPGRPINASAPALVNEPGEGEKGSTYPRAERVCPLDEGVQQHNLDLVSALLDRYPRLDGVTLDDNFEFQNHPCRCQTCWSRFRAYCRASGQDEGAPGVRDGFWQAQVKAFVRQVGARCAARQKPLGAWRELAAAGDDLSQEALDFHGAMGYAFPPVATLAGPHMPPGKHAVKLLWGMDRRPQDILAETTEAVHAGGAAVGYWISFDRVDGDSSNWGYGVRNPDPGEASLAPGTLDAIAQSFARVEQDWADYYRENLLSGDTRFVLLSASLTARSLTLQIQNTGQRVRQRVVGPVDLGPLSPAGWAE